MQVLQVLRGLSFTVQPHSCVAIVGPSGMLFVCVLLCRSASLVSMCAFLRPRRQRRHLHASLDGPPRLPWMVWNLARNTKKVHRHGFPAEVRGTRVAVLPVCFELGARGKV